MMTIKRKGANFPGFLQKLLSRVAYGETMPVAWSHFCPQIPGLGHAYATDSIFFAGRGGVMHGSGQDSLVCQLMINPHITH